MSARTPDGTDAHVGRRVRQRRNEIGQSQAQLGDAIGLSFQQVQKYERGGNRISAGTLIAIARAQRVPVAYYFEGIDQPGAPEQAPAAREAREWLETQEAWTLALMVAPMPAGFRQGLAKVAQALADLI